ncbi:hypothetical protein [Mesorhizobium amorphae]|uniref:hypothetical protein n=1 Tax=Mesorhizobium amorphae TaxID=71433 RepID=UPI0011825449|nr:hypothetical protein [Mesorhizobium amorphae]
MTRLECLDGLNQLEAELVVIWCALLNPDHGEECTVPIAEHVNGVKNRLRAISKALEGGAK